jgi:lipid II:glycine glycyltransferase (peptidoglycan interpeptide bridge formation enzyme)
METITEFRLGRDLRQSQEYGHFMEKIGWEAEKMDNALMLLRKIGPFQIGKLRRPARDANWNKILKNAREKRLLYLQVDPEDDDPVKYKQLGFRKNKDQLLGTKTLLIDLREDETKILAGFKPETRYKLRKLEKLNFTKKINDYDGFYQILKQGYKEINVWCPGKDEYNALVESFGEKVFCITFDDTSGCLILLNKGVAEYYYAAATSAGKANNLPYWTVWEAMREAKKRGAKIWDFNGLFDERYPDKRWKGFSFFKTRFNGTELEFAGTYSKFLGF